MKHVIMLLAVIAAASAVASAQPKPGTVSWQWCGYSIHNEQRCVPSPCDHQAWPAARTAEPCAQRGQSDCRHDDWPGMKRSCCEKTACTDLYRRNCEMIGTLQREYCVSPTELQRLRARNDACVGRPAAQSRCSKCGAMHSGESLTGLHEELRTLYRASMPARP